jgi:hypothetical protein
MLTGEKGLHPQYGQTQPRLHDDPSQWGRTDLQQTAQQFTGPPYGTLMYNQPRPDGDLHSHDARTPQDRGNLCPHQMWNDQYPHPAESTSFTSEWPLPQHEAPNLDGGSQNWAPNQPLSDPSLHQYLGQPNEPEWGRSFREYPPPTLPLPVYVSTPLPHFNHIPNLGFSPGARYYAENPPDGSHEFYQPTQSVPQYSISESQFRSVGQQGPPHGPNVHVPQRHEEWRSQETSAEQYELNQRFKVRLHAGRRRMTAAATGIAPQAGAMQDEQEHISQPDHQRGKDALSSVQWDLQMSLHPPPPPPSPSFPSNDKNQTSHPLRLRTATTVAATSEPSSAYPRPSSPYRPQRPLSPIEEEEEGEEGYDIIRMEEGVEGSLKFRR